MILVDTSVWTDYFAARPARRSCGCDRQIIGLLTLFAAAPAAPQSNDD